MHTVLLVPSCLVTQDQISDKSLYNVTGGKDYLKKRPSIERSDEDTTTGSAIDNIPDLDDLGLPAADEPYVNGGEELVYGL